jgi:hypothetical protein
LLEAKALRGIERTAGAICVDLSGTDAGEPELALAGQRVGAQLPWLAQIGA